jgi:hypothetical protein
MITLLEQQDWILRIETHSREGRRQTESLKNSQYVSDNK